MLLLMIGVVSMQAPQGVKIMDDKNDNDKPDIHELVRDNTVAKWRQQQIEEAVSFISDIWKNTHHPEYFRGALDMLKKIMYIPLKNAKPENYDLISTMVKAEIKTVETRLLRRIMMEAIEE